ncbi:MAG TPA: VOC family protein [Solirubrobacteraceae bacterium]
MAELANFSLPRLRQAVVAARDLDAVAGELRERLGLSEPYADPGVSHFGLRNAVFALGDTFLEVVSPTQAETAAGRLIDRRGGDCGYMLMFQVGELDGRREQARELGIREVFEVSVDDMAEVHLHPADIRGAIVSLSQPTPPASWRWGGPDWDTRSASRSIAGATLEVPDAGLTTERWRSVLGEEPEWLGVRLTDGDRGLTEIVIEGLETEFTLAGVRFAPSDYEEE